MSINTQAQFWLRNICDFPEKALKDRTDLPGELMDGLRAFRELLSMIYSDYRSYEVSTVKSEQTKIGIMTDDLENYHNLTDTLACLCQIAAIGALQSEGEVHYLLADKALFKAGFKKSPAFPLEKLAQYGFYYSYMKNRKEVGAYRSCDTFLVYSDHANDLIPAMKYLMDRLPDTNVKEDYAANHTPFLLADYRCILLNEITKRQDISPYREGIRRTIGSLGLLWEGIVDTLRDQYGLGTNCSMNTYVHPNWAIRFTKGKRTVVTFEIRVDELSIRLPLSYEHAKQVILSRDTLPESIRRSVEGFGCAHCGKCADQSNIEMFEGIALCKLGFINFVTEDSRCVRIRITTKEEADALCSIIGAAVKA